MEDTVNRISPLPTPPTAIARAYQFCAPYANGQPPEHHLASGTENPRRICLAMIPEGAALMTLARRPFPDLQPNAKLGPIFLSADACTVGGSAAKPDILTSPDYYLRGYGPDNRLPSAGAVIPTPLIPTDASHLLVDLRVNYVHVRSACNNCCQLLIDRAYINFSPRANIPTYAAIRLARVSGRFASPIR